MRYVVHVTGMSSKKYGGIESYFLEIAKSLKNKNYKLILVYETFPTSDKFVKDLYEQDVEIKIISARKNPLVFFMKFVKLLLTKRPKILHCHFEPALHFSMLISFLFFVKKRYMTIHSTVLPKNRLKLKSKVIGKIGGFSATKIFTVSDAVKKQYIDTFGFSKKVERAYIGVKPYKQNKHLLRKELKLPDISKLIAITAFHDDVKGIDILIKALALLKTKYKLDNVFLIQIGGGEESKTLELKKLATKLKVSKNIIWMGLQNRVLEIISAVDVYCQPSRYEGIGLSLMEASWASIPLVGTKIGGIPEVIKHEENGYLVASEDYVNLALSLHKVLTNEKRSKEMAEKSYAIANKYFNLELNVKEYIKKYY